MTVIVTLPRGSLRRRATAPCALALCLAPAAATAQSHPNQTDDIVVTGTPAPTTQQRSSTQASIDAATIKDTVNAVNVEDAIKYLPSLIVRKRHIGDTQSPLATRTSGLGASARSLIFADGILLSSLIGNNNTTASPRWSMVSPEEIERIDVIYGPFSAAYAGNSIGAVVNIITRLPDRLEATLTAGTSIQTFDQYATRRTLPARQFAATLGDRIGQLALFGSVTRTTSDSQPLAYVTSLRPANPTIGGLPTAGGIDTLNRGGQPIHVFGASGFEHQRQTTIKLKAALDLSTNTRLAYTLGLFDGDTDATAETYLTTNGQPTYVSPTGPIVPLNINGYAYTILPSAFDAGVYRHVERHAAHALSLTHTSSRIDWQVIGSRYTFGHDSMRTPTGALPGAFAGGQGTITRLDGTGWTTLDANAAWHADDASANTLSGGVHWDRFRIESNRYPTANWLSGDQGAVNLTSRGRTRTTALWAQDEARLADRLTLTLGGRYEWWRADRGYAYSLTPVLAVVQPVRTAQGFSPKAALAFTPAPGWTARLSIGKAYRFPTVGELYQTVATGTVLTVPDPSLRPERALSEELALEKRDRHGSARVSLFNESIADALVSQSAPLVPGSPTLYTYIQNVDRTRARGIEVAVSRTDFPVRRVDLSGGATYADATTRADAAFPAAIGKDLPSVPRWKASGVATWRPTDTVALTAAARYASRSYGTLDNSDAVENTYQAFGHYVVVDLRAAFKAGPHYTVAIGVDNVNNARYFLFHPFPQRTLHADVTLRL